MSGITPRIIRSRRRSLALHISKDGEVIVKAPILVPNFIIQGFIKEKHDWIEKTLEKVHKRKSTKRLYKEGEEYLFLGKPHKLTFTDGIRIEAKDNRLYFPKALTFRMQKELKDWFLHQAKQLITSRVAYQSQRMHASYKDIFFSDTQSKWGTCFSDNTLQFNWRLIMAPLMIIDYVVIHELTHTTHHHHQADFWNHVRKFTPAYRQHRKWLEENAHLLVL